MDREPPGAQYALRIVNFGSPLVRTRYPRGVLVDPDGFPVWSLFARAMVRLPDPVPGLTVDELRVLDVLAANAVFARGEDPLRTPAPAPAESGPPGPVPTPQGWTWAHLGGTRDVALVPIELHASFRHAGGVRTMPVDRRERGLWVDYVPQPAGADQFRRVPEEVLLDLERHLRFPLPPDYRTFFAQTNGAAPARPGVLPGHGFLADQRFFGLARDDDAQDIIGANQFLADRLTDEFLAVGYVQGGIIAVKVRGEDSDSVWYWDDDDDRAERDHDAAYIRDHLLHRCADTIRQFWDRLSVPATSVLDLADQWVRTGAAEAVRPDGIGDSLPADRRPAWQPASVPDEVYFANPVIQAAMLS
jgi:hypothetical protein